jgi:hypothetical protein
MVIAAGRRGHRTVISRAEVCRTHCRVRGSGLGPNRAFPSVAGPSGLTGSSMATSGAGAAIRVIRLPCRIYGLATNDFAESCVPLDWPILSLGRRRARRRHHTRRRRHARRRHTRHSGRGLRWEYDRRLIDGRRSRRSRRDSGLRSGRWRRDRVICRAGTGRATNRPPIKVGVGRRGGAESARGGQTALVVHTVVLHRVIPARSRWRRALGGAGGRPPDMSGGSAAVPSAHDARSAYGARANPCYGCTRRVACREYWATYKLDKAGRSTVRAP